MTTKPQCLVDALKRANIRNPRAFNYEKSRKRLERAGKLYKRATVSASLDLSAFVDSRRSIAADESSLNDMSNKLRENLDLWCYASNEYSREYWKEYADDARAMLRYLSPNMPERIVRASRSALECDLTRAIVNATEDDYEAQFIDYLHDRLTDAVDESMPAGVHWCALDAKGEPTAYLGEAESIGVFASQKVAADKSADWNEYAGDETRAERIDNAPDRLAEHIADVAEKLHPDYFDERGSVYADPKQWPIFMDDYGSETAEDWRKCEKKMRERLRDMIRNRAPLELRASLVATVYGVPGTMLEGEDE